MKILVILTIILISFPDSQLSAKSKKNDNGVGPLLETEWGQGGLYQTFTPKITKSWDSEVWLGQAYLGCTTVATAQVLKYYGYQNIKYLERYQEYSNCYPLGNHLRSGLKGEDVDKNGVLCIKGVAKGFDFDSLVSKLPDVSIDKNGDGKMDKGIFKKFPSKKRKGYQKTAKFLYQISAMVNAEYGGKTGAAAHPNFLERLFEQHFGYASDGSLSKRKNLKMGDL
ncbi:C10 family peptidase [Bacteriovoracales bacterium]|nr:C10 family peptidase [Bacteriovoracales bacterium]